VLHGGPGAGHDYLEPLEELATDRPVVFYDQLGCGKSDKPDDLSLWRMERFVAEVDTVRQALGLKEIHLLGQSWGGMLAIEYMLTRPSGIVSLTLASAAASLSQAEAEFSRLRAELPPETKETLQRYEAVQDYQNPEYEAAILQFYRRHMFRPAELPEPLLRTIANQAVNPAGETMEGPSPFVLTGNLRDWDRTDRLGEISAPTLITVGRYDELTPNCAETLRRGIPDSQMVLFEASSHMAHLEETQKFLQVVAGFLASIDPPV
jgi:proline-specific peptidase